MIPVRPVNILDSVNNLDPAMILEPLNSLALGKHCSPANILVLSLGSNQEGGAGGEKG